MWSVGCIMAELIIGRPLFPGDKEMKQCELIFQICGSPEENGWPESKSLPHYSTYAPNTHSISGLRNLMKKQNPDLDEATLDLLDALLHLNPEKRIKAKDALEHEYFKCEPLPPKELIGLPDQECHYTLLKNREKERQLQQNESNSKDNNYGPNSNSKRKYNEAFGEKSRNQGGFYQQNSTVYPPFGRPNPPAERPEFVYSSKANNGNNNSESEYRKGSYHPQQYPNSNRNLGFSSNPPPPKLKFNEQVIDSDPYSHMDSDPAPQNRISGLGALISQKKSEGGRRDGSAIDYDPFGNTVSQGNSDEFEKIKKKLHK